MLVDMLSEAFKPHKMYDPKTGEEVDAKTKADHLRYKAMGYTHDKPKLEESILGKLDKVLDKVESKLDRLARAYNNLPRNKAKLDRENKERMERVLKNFDNMVAELDRAYAHVDEEVQLDEEARGQHGNIQMDNIGDPENPNVVVSGYGVLSVNFLRKEISKRLKELATRLERGDSDFLIRELTPGKGILKLFVDALEDVETQMKTPAVKRKLTMLKKKKG